MTPTIHFQNSCCKPKYFDPSDLFLLLSSYGIADPKNQSIDSLMLAQRLENDPIVR